MMAEDFQCDPAPTPSSACSHLNLEFKKRHFWLLRLQTSCLSAPPDLDQMTSFLIKTSVFTSENSALIIPILSAVKTRDIPAWCAYHIESTKGRQIAWSFSSLVQATRSTKWSEKPESFQVRRLKLYLRFRIDFCFGSSRRKEDLEGSLGWLFAKAEVREDSVSVSWTLLSECKSLLENQA